jgi:hypothetical protein
MHAALRCSAISRALTDQPPVVDHVKALSLSAVEGSPTAAAGKVASVQEAARWFFIAAALIALADILLVPWLKHELPNALIGVALVLALVGIAADFATKTTRAASARSSLLERVLASDGWSAFAAGVMFLAFYAATISRPTPYTEPVQQAYAFLHGRSWVDAPDYMEHIVWHGKSYLLHPPLAALITLPAVAIWGLATNQTAISVVVGAVSLGLVWRLLCKIGLGIASRVWLTLFFGIGTTFWYEATLGSSWDFSLLVTVPFTLAALGEVFGEARPWAVGVLAAMPALARYDMALAWPCYAGFLWVSGRKMRELLSILPSMVAVVALSAAFNEARFGTPYDVARWLWYNQDKYRFARPGGPLALSHFPFNLYTLLFMAPSYSDKFPYIHPEFLGQALLLTSPAFVLALRPSFLRPTTALVALAAALCTGPIMLWYANGFAQLGTRFYVEIYPFLLTLIALGAPRKLDQLTKILIVVSIVFVAFFTWQVRWYGWGG